MQNSDIYYRIKPECLYGDKLKLILKRNVDIEQIKKEKKRLSENY